MHRDDIDIKTKRRLFKLTAFSYVAFLCYSRLPLQGTEVAVKRIHHKKLAKGNSRRLLISEVSTMQVGASPLRLSLCCCFTTITKALTKNSSVENVGVRPTRLLTDPNIFVPLARVFTLPLCVHVARALGERVDVGGETSERGAATAVHRHSQSRLPCDGGASAVFLPQYTPALDLLVALWTERRAAAWHLLLESTWWVAARHWRG
jgi:hypothetical protein